MSSKVEIPKLLAWVAASCMATACSGADVAQGPNSVCPVRQGPGVSQIDIFDGDPAELASLAPDDGQKGANTYTVKGIYDQGRYVTIRCHYGRAAAVDVKLANRVAQCTFSGSEAHPALTCK